jgi:predicted nuclease of restriction endonuclease-like RecB superfamily
MQTQEKILPQMCLKCIWIRAMTIINSKILKISSLWPKNFSCPKAGTLTDEQRQQSLDIAQKYLGITKVHNGIWADNNKEDFINSLKSLPPAACFGSTNI